MASSPSDTGEVLFACQGLRKVYPGVVALDDVGIEIRAGQFHGLLGENGAGKSTLIKVIGGATTPDAGTLTWRGQRVEMRSPGDAAELGISIVPQQLLVLRRKTVAENIMLGLGYPKRGIWLDRAAGRAQAREVLAAFDLDLDPDLELGRLPLHLQRMVVIALAVARKARLVIMDEPTASLNAGEIEMIQGAVRRLTESGVAVLYVTHRLSEIASSLDWVTVLRNGRVVLSRDGEGLVEEDLVTAIAGRELAQTRERARLDRNVPDRPIALALRGASAGTIREVDLDLPTGRVVGITGAIGAGAGDVGRLLFGTLPLEAGEMSLDAEPYEPSDPRDALNRGVVYLAQDRARTGLLMRKSIRENCMLAPLSLGLFRRPGWRVDVRAGSRSTGQMVERLRIDAPSEERAVSTLSGGNQQKVLLARSLLCDPRVLILDEPTEGVDVGARADFFEMVRALADDGRGVIIISTDWEELAGVCDEVVVLREGRVVGDLRGDELSVERLTRIALGAEVAG